MLDLLNLLRVGAGVCLCCRSCVLLILVGRVLLLVFVFRLRWFYFVRGLLGETAVTCDGLSQRIAASQGEERAAYLVRPQRTPMTVDERKEWSRQGGRAALVFGLARRWTSETARAANAKRTMPGSSRMAKTGRLGGLHVRRRRRQQQASPLAESPPSSTGPTLLLWREPGAMSLGESTSYSC